MRRYKPLIQSISILILTGILFWGALVGIKNQNIKLSDINKYSGKVVLTGETIRPGKINSKVFFVSLSGLPQTLGVYRKSGNYHDLSSQIKKDDVLTVYYKRNSSNKINIDLVQIEKGDLVILNKREFEKKQSFLIWVGLIGGTICMVSGIYNYKRHQVAINRIPFRI